LSLEYGSLALKKWELPAAKMFSKVKVQLNGKAIAATRTETGVVLVAQLKGGDVLSVQLS
jgi:hypothetical protein